MFVGLFPKFPQKEVNSLPLGLTPARCLVRFGLHKIPKRRNYGQMRGPCVDYLLPLLWGRAGSGLLMALSSLVGTMPGFSFMLLVRVDKCHR